MHIISLLGATFLTHLTEQRPCKEVPSKASTLSWTSCVGLSCLEKQWQCTVGSSSLTGFPFKRCLKTSRNSIAMAGKFMMMCAEFFHSFEERCLSSSSFTGPFKKFLPSRLKTLTFLSTLFNLQLCWSHLHDSGLRSFANTMQFFFAAGIAKGPTPAKTSKRRSPGFKRLTIRKCSVERRGFQ